MSTDPLLEELLAKPVGPATQPRTAKPEDFTSIIEMRGDSLEATVKGERGTVNEGTAARFLEAEGQNPDEWEVTHFRKIEYGNPESPYESVKFSYRRVASDQPLEVPLDDLISAIKMYSPPWLNQADGDHGFIVPIGDMQFGKIDGDGPAGTVRRTIEAINRAADELERFRRIFDIGHVHIPWLGDHVEGFVSQGGANSWRTQLTLNEQIRLTRRVMLHALTTFAPLAERVTMAALPGNHGETVRFAGTGVTRYDDSHDTEALIAVRDTAEMMPEHFGHVDFYVPDTDELIVMTEVAGTNIAHHHGHKWRPGKHWEWWSDQAFNPSSPMHMADVLLAGHLHHDHFEINGRRTYWGQPALESESTWFRHVRGTGGAPGINVGIVKDGRVLVRKSIHV